jgi:hypothetical protein
LVGVQNATTTYRNQVVSAADNYAESEDYASALYALNNAIEFLNNDPEINQRVIRFTQDYRTKILRDADSALNEEGYLAAIQIVRTGLQTLRGDTELLNAVAEFELYAPIKIWDRDFYTVSRGWSGFTNEMVDNYGNTQTNVIFTVDEVLPGDTGAVKNFLLNGEYSRLEGTLFRSYEGRGVVTRNDAPRISIRCDDELIFSAQINVGDEPIAFNIDLTGVRVVRIGIITANHTMGNGQEVGGVADLFLYRR